MKRRISLLLFVLLVSCASLRPAPEIAFGDVEWAEKPHIVRRGDWYYMRYRVAVGRGPRLPLRQVRAEMESDDKVYFYFGGAVSALEWGNVVEVPLAAYGFTNHARNASVYWLDPDGTETQLEILDEGSGGSR